MVYKMEDSLILIKVTMDAISSDNIDKITEYLMKMPLEKMDQEHSDKILQMLLSEATLLNRGEAAKIIMKRFSDVNANEERVPLFTHLFTTLYFSDDILKFLSRLYPEYTLTEHIVNLIEYADQGPMITRACERIIDTYGGADFYTYKLLYLNAEDNENDLIMEYMTAKLEETSDYAPKPEWVKNFVVWLTPNEEGYIEEPPDKIVAIAKDREVMPTEETIPYNDEILLPEPEKIAFEIPPLDETVELLTDGLGFLGISLEDREEAQQVLRSIISISTNEEKYRLLLPIMKNKAQQDLSNDIALFRIFGPSNPIVDADLSDPKQECRMLECNKFAQYDPETDTYNEDADWFTGNCDFCFLKIENYSHAIRKPLTLGAWEGCYCSFKCLRNDFDETDVDIAQQAMINRIEGQLYQYGIQDRLDRP